MATRAILRRRRALASAWTQPSGSFRCFSSFEHGQSCSAPHSQDSSLAVVLPSLDSDSRNERKSFSLTKDKLQLFSSVGILRNNLSGSSRLVDERLNYRSSLGAAWRSQLLRYSSTATSGQPEFRSGNEKSEEKIATQKEASPEECDQAVEGLSSAKEKAKAKQMQELRKSGKSILRRVWATLLGIGPALRAVASMSR